MVPLKSSGKWREDAYLAFRDNYRAIISSRLNVNHPSQVVPHGDGIYRHLNGREVIRMPIIRHHQHRLDALSANSILGLQQPPCHAFRSFQRAAASVRVTTPCRTGEQDHKEQANKNGGSVMHTEQNAPYNLLSDPDPPSLPLRHTSKQSRSNLSPPHLTRNSKPRILTPCTQLPTATHSKIPPTANSSNSVNPQHSPPHHLHT